MKLTEARLNQLLSAMPEGCRNPVKEVSVTRHENSPASAKHEKSFTFRLSCRSGVLVLGSSTDFLTCVERARDTKRKWMRALPFSTLRVQLFYPNRKRASLEDIKAALRTLAKLAIDSSTVVRAASSTSKAPARSEARTAAFEGSGSGFFAVGVDVDFSQAGVVAPPDGLTGETFQIPA